MVRRTLVGRVLAAALCVAAVGSEARAIVTANVFGGSVLGTGDPLGDSVAFLVMTDASGAQAVGSGTLIGNGDHVLTAGHNLLGTNGSPFVATSVDVLWPTSGGLVQRSAISLDAHSAYQFNSTDRIGYDLAVLTLDSTAPVSIPRQDILRDTSGVEFTGGSTVVPGLKIGYGGTGIGSVGYDPLDPAAAPGTKRFGANTYEVTLGTENDRILGYDFDDGTVTTSAFGTGSFGASEVSAAPGDSGGPTYINAGGQDLIAGVTSFGLNGLTTDVNPSLFASFGDVGGDVRVSDPLNQNFIDLIVNHDRLLGDTNNDGTLDALDIDTLWDAVYAAASVVPWLDLNLDGLVDSADVDSLVYEVFQTSYADGDLDGDVDIGDLSLLGGGAYGNPTTGGWSAGDFNNDGFIDVVDLAYFGGGNYGFVRDTSSFGGSLSFTTAAVPEPASAGLLMLALVGVGWRRR